MKTINIKECNFFHDATIEKITYNEETLILYLHNFICENSCYDAKLEIQLEEFESDFDIYYIKQYPKFHKPKIKGKQTSLKFLESFFEKGYVLEINEFLVSTDSNLIVLCCVFFPYAKKRGVYHKIILTISYKYNYVILKERNEC